MGKVVTNPGFARGWAAPTVGRTGARATQERPLSVRGLAVHAGRVNRWLDARSGWTLLLCLWGCTLTGALLGVLTTRTFFETGSPPPLSTQLPWTFGGSLFVAVVATAGRLGRRRRAADRTV